jgi:phosphoglycerol transferase
MNWLAHKLKSLTPATAVLLAATCLLIFLIARNCGLFPSVLADEWTYSEYSRLAPRSQAPVPSYLFFFLFGTTRFFGQGFLECARIYNACAFALALVFIYAVCRLCASHKVSLFIAILSVIGPINTYSAYFMPESTYFCAFWILTWFLLRNIEKNPSVLGTGTGAILGLMAMIKFHAVFLLPGFAAFMLFAWITKAVNLTLKSALYTLLFAGLAFVAVRFGGGYLLAGKAGLQLAGQGYASIASPASDPTHLSNVLGLGWQPLVGHLLALSFLLPVPLAAVVCMNWRRPLSASQPGGISALLKLLGLSFLPPLLFITTVSTALFANGSPYDTTARLHLRYYNFIFPLFFIIAVCELRTPVEKRTTRRKLVAPLILAGAGLVAVTIGLKQYVPNIVDSPELSISSSASLLLLSGFLGIVSVLIWSYKQRIGAMVYLYLFLPFTVVSAAQFAFHELAFRRDTTPYDDAGRFARLFLGRQTSKLTIVGSELIGLYKTLFNVDNPETSILQIPPGAPLELSELPTGKNWALVLGDHEATSPPHYRISLWAYSIVNFSADNVIDFRNNGWPGILEKITGVSDAEEFGRWTDGPAITMQFISPLPKRFRFVLKARAIGPNVDLPFTIEIGQQEKQFRLGSSLQSVDLPFETDGLEKAVRIDIPRPISPKELWHSADQRLLGAALEQISISEVK